MNFNPARHISMDTSLRCIPVGLVLIGMLCFPAPCRGKSGDFEEAVAGRLPVYQQAGESQAELFLAGRMEEAFALLTDLVPEEEQGPADWFLLGNMLYDLAPELSRGYHRRAYEAEPGEPLVILEWALQQHRAGHHGEAAELYRGFLKKMKREKRYYALLADCQFRLGDVKGALKSWKKAGFDQGHTAIDLAIHSVYGDLNPWTRRAALLEALKSDPARVAELILLDLDWEIDWWNADVKRDALNHDMALIRETMGGESWRFLDLETLVHIETSRDMSSARVGQRLESAGLILGDGRLPLDSPVASALIRRVLSEELATPQELYGAFAEELDKRARSAAGDVEALNLLAALALEVDKGKIEGIDRLGWDRYGDERFACSLLAGRGAELKLNDPDLQRAMAEFPDCPDVWLMAAGCAATEGAPTRDLMVRLICAEFNGMKSDPHRFGHRLNAYIDTLRAVIEGGYK